MGHPIEHPFLTYPESIANRIRPASQEWSSSWNLNSTRVQDLSINRLYPTLSPTHELWPPILYQRRVHSSHQKTSISFPLSKASFIVAGDGIYMRRDQDNAPYHSLLIVRGLARSPLVEICRSYHFVLLSYPEGQESPQRKPQWTSMGKR